MNNNSIYDIIKSSIIDGKLPEDFSLPKLHSEDEMVFVDGGLDGVYTFHMPLVEMSKEDYSKMAKAITLASDRDFNSATELFEEISRNNRAISIHDTMQEYILENKEKIRAGNLYEFSIGLIELSNNIECIKYGLTILEIMNTNNEELKDVIRTLALSDEFTLFCVLIMNTWSKGNDDIFETAKNVYGWGRIQAVRFLRPLMPRDEEIRMWMLKEGINNYVSPSYSALTIWREGNIGSILFVEPTQEEFKYIGRILDAMLDEDAVAGISTLDKRKEILLKYLEKAKKFSLNIGDYETIYNISKYGEEINEDEIVKQAKDLLTSFNAKEKVIDAVKQGHSLNLAIDLNIDVKPYVLKLIKDNFKEKNHLCRYLAHDKNYRKELLNIYNQNLNLDEIKTKATTSLGLGKEYWKESALEFLLQELRPYPLEGIEFVETGLQASPTRTRNSAISVLQNWVSNKKKALLELLPNIYSLISELVQEEPVDNIKDNMNSLLNGEIEFKEKEYVLEEERIDQETLNILSDAISDIGVWQWWHKQDDMIQMEFGCVQLYDEFKEEKQAHSSTIALRFNNNSFAMFLDNFEKEDEKKWFDKLYDDEINPFDLEGFEFKFNDGKYVNEIFEAYKNKHTIKELIDEDIVSCKYILAAKCYDVAFVVGGNKLEILTHQGILSEDDIKKANEKWWKYWEDYWHLRNTKDAYEKDPACELTIPVRDN